MQYDNSIKVLDQRTEEQKGPIKLPANLNVRVENLCQCHRMKLKIARAIIRKPDMMLLQDLD